MLKISNSEPEAIIKHLSKLAVPLQILPLSELRWGDYAWADGSTSIGIERKTFMDFVGSYQMGRLHNQIAGCLNTYAHSFILLEGCVDTDGFDPLMNNYKRTGRTFIRNNIASVGNVHGFTKQLLNTQQHVDIIYSSCHVMSAQIIAGLYNKFEINPLLEIVPRTKKGISPNTFSIKEIALLRSIPRLSQKGAMSLIKTCGSISTVCLQLQTDPNSLLKLEGIGKQTIVALKEVLL